MLERNIAIIISGGIGDLILSYPAIDAIVKKFSKDKVTIVCPKDRFSIFFPLLDVEFLEFETSGVHLIYGDFNTDRFSHKLRWFFRSDLLFYFGFDIEFEKKVRKTHKKKVFRIEPFPKNSRLHVTDFQKIQLENIGIGVNMGYPNLEKIMENSKNTKYSYFIIHPGSGSPKKRWPLCRFLELFFYLKRRYERGYFLVGPAEADILCVLREKIRDSILKIENLLEVARFIYSSSLYVGCDSGITHLASALGVKTFAIFGPTDDAIFGPLGKNTKIIKSPTWCSPCNLKRECKTLFCLLSVKTSHVISEMESNIS